MNPIKFDAVILAGGSSQRFGSDKLLFSVDGEEMICRTVRIFADCKYVSSLLIVCNTANIDKIKNVITEKICTNKSVDFIAGGTTRAESSYNGLKFFEDKGEDNILFTDADRCFVSESLLERLVGSFTDNAIPAIRHNETMRIIKDGRYVSQIKDENLFEIQTPQLYRKSMLVQAYAKCFSSQASDESIIFSQCFSEKKLNIVKGDPANIKVAYPQDIERSK